MTEITSGLALDGRSKDHLEDQLTYTVGLLLPTCRTIDIVPTRAADSSTMRDRQTYFCGVLRSAIQLSSCARSSGDSQTHISVFIRQLSHNPTQKGILC